MTEEIEDRLEFHEPGSDTEHEIWKDPVTGKFYKVKIEIERDFKNAEEL